MINEDIYNEVLDFIEDVSCYLVPNMDEWGEIYGSDFDPADALLSVAERAQDILTRIEENQELTEDEEDELIEGIDFGDSED